MEVLQKYAINTYDCIHGLVTNRKTIQVHHTATQYAAQHSMHQSMWFSKVHNSVKLDVRLSEWDDTCYVTYV